MNLSHKLTFSIFSILLVAMFAFVATEAVAVVEVTVEGAASGDNGLKVTIKYSVNADPALVAADVTGDSGDLVTFTKVNAKEFTVVDPDSTTIGLTVQGYVSITVSTTTTPTKLTVAGGHIGGHAFAVITDNNTAIDNNPDNPVYPTLPTITPAITKRGWWQHDGDSDTGNTTPMPDLYALFQVNGGGTLDLTLHAGVQVNTDSAAATPAQKARSGDSDARTIRINEVMWAYDDDKIGTADKTQQQWIEIYNTKTTPIALDRIVFTTSKAYPAPTNASTDRLSNVPNYINTWSFTKAGQEKGQHGNSNTNSTTEFISMHRTNPGSGWAAGHWAAAGDLFLPKFKGTPGAPNSTTGVQDAAQKKPATDWPEKNKIVINEIANNTGDSKDWIELKNVTDSAQSLNEWTLTISTGFGNETEIIRFPNKPIPAKGVLLLVQSEQVGTDLAVGNKITADASDQEFGYDRNVRYLKIEKLKLPDNQNWLLILRNKKPWDKNVYQSGWKVQDVAGPGGPGGAFEKYTLNTATPVKEKKEDGSAGGDIWHTTIFPLNGHSQTASVEKQGNKDFLQADRLTKGKVFRRDTGKHGFQKDAWIHVGFTGIGYKRNAARNDTNGGTPGYDNDIVTRDSTKISDLDGGKLIISEMMLSTDRGRYPQWIELHNTSKTQGINIVKDDKDPKDGWTLHIENHNSGSWNTNNRPLNVKVNLKDWFTYIPPNQTVLIASVISRNSELAYFPTNRVGGVFNKHKTTFKMANRRDVFLNVEGGFHIEIKDPHGVTSDEVGNLDGVAAKTGTFSFVFDDPVWGWTDHVDVENGETAFMTNGSRTSIIRIRDNGVHRPAVAKRDADEVATNMAGRVIPMNTSVRGAGKVGTGEKKLTWAKYADYAWVHASDTALAEAQHTWYGSSDDIGTPGHTTRTPLPVELSFFRPTLENGKVTIQWTTESELDNAGFNILRSDTRNGEFKQVNEQMIQGNGTTAERTTYKWVDTTAKPGAVYYYQIEDVSFAGEHNTLATTKLKGLISAKGKLTTQWGDLKNLR